MHTCLLNLVRDSYALTGRLHLHHEPHEGRLGAVLHGAAAQHWTVPVSRQQPHGSSVRAGLEQISRYAASTVVLCAHLGSVAPHWRPLTHGLPLREAVVVYWWAMLVEHFTACECSHCTGNAVLHFCLCLLLPLRSNAEVLRLQA
jgi:hypothetical protein